VEILIYITDTPERVLGGNPLCLKMPNDEERQKFLEVIAESFDASVMKLKNGDHIVVKRDK